MPFDEFDEFLRVLWNDARSDVANILYVVEMMRSEIEAGKPVEGKLLQISIELILRSAYNLHTILDAAMDYSKRYRTNKTG